MYKTQAVGPNTSLRLKSIEMSGRRWKHLPHVRRAKHFARPSRPVEQFGRAKTTFTWTAPPARPLYVPQPACSRDATCGARARTRGHSNTSPAFPTARHAHEYSSKRSTQQQPATCCTHLNFHGSERRVNEQGGRLAPARHTHAQECQVIRALACVLRFRSSSTAVPARTTSSPPRLGLCGTTVNESVGA